MSMQNNWHVPYSSIVWFYNTMKAHNKVNEVVREKDILFTITDVGEEISLLYFLMNIEWEKPLYTKL